MSKVWKLDHQGYGHEDVLAWTKYYEQAATVGTDAAAIALFSPAASLHIHPTGTTAVSYRTALPIYGPDYVGVAQVIGGTVTGEVLQGGIFQALVTAAGMNSGTTETVNGTISGARQVETLTVVGTVGTTGTLDVYLYSGLYGTDAETWTLDVTKGDTPPLVAAKIYAAIGGSLTDAAGTTLYYTLANPGTTDALIMTAYRAAANDTTFIWGYEDQLDLTDGTSADTTAGAAPSTITQVTQIIGSAMRANDNVGSFFTLAFSGTNAFKLTARTVDPHDSTMRFTFNNSSTVGLTEGTSSVTTYGTNEGDGYWFTAAASAVTSIEPPSRCIPDPLYYIGTVWVKATEDTHVELTYWGHPKVGTASCVASS